MSQFCKNNGITQLHVAPRKPSTKGLEERNNQTVKQNIKNILKEKKQSRNHCCQVLGEAAYKKNIVEHEATKQTPYELVFGIPPWKETKATPDNKHDQHEEEEEDVDAEPARKRACYSLIKSTKEIRTTQQEKASNTERKFNNKMTTRKPYTILFQVNNFKFVKIKINKVDKSPIHPNTLLGKVIEKEHGFMKVVTKFEIIDTWIAPNRLQITEDMNVSLDTTKTTRFTATSKKKHVTSDTCTRGAKTRK